MKLRFFIISLVGLLLIPACIFAEEATTMPPSAFAFRDGITWGISMENVLTLESGEAYSDSVGESVVLRYGQVSVSNYSATLSYIFQDNILVSAFYYFEDSSLRDYFYLLSALSSKYGDPISPDINRQTTLFCLLGIPEEEAYKLANWELADGTYIALFSPDGDDTDFVLMYFDEESLLLKNKVYNTVGL